MNDMDNKEAKDQASGKKDLFSSLDIQHMADVRPEFERRREDICRIARKEGLTAHSNSIEVRFEKDV